MPHRRRWFQFSTRALLLLLTALCGWLAYLSESARRQRDAVVLLAPVALISYDDHSIVIESYPTNNPRAGALGYFERCLGKDYFVRVNQVLLYPSLVIEPEHLTAITCLDPMQLGLADNDSVDDVFVSRLVGLPRLRELFVDETRVTDASFQPISQMLRLKLLSAEETAIDGSGFRFLRVSRSLSHLLLGSTRITDEHLGELGRCRHLEYVDLRNTRVTADGVARLQLALPKCEIRWRD